MEERNLNEQESLELITRMIQRTRVTHVLLHTGFILWCGYSALVIAVVSGIVTRVTEDVRWMWGCVLIPLCWALAGWMAYRHRSPSGYVMSYSDRMLVSVWMVCLSFMAMVVCMMVMGGTYAFIFSWAGAALGLGCMLSGSVLRDNYLIQCGIMTLVAVLAGFGNLLESGHPLAVGAVTMGLYVVTSLILPGHRLRRKWKEESDKFHKEGES